MNVFEPIKSRIVLKRHSLSQGRARLVAVGLVAVLTGTVATHAAEQSVGTVAGTITYAGRVPKVTQPDLSGAYRDRLAVDRRSGGLRDAVVYLTPLDGRQEGDLTPPVATKKKPSSTAHIDQVEHTFEPHVIVIRRGDAVRFTNSDAGNHHLRTTAGHADNRFDVYTGPDGNYEHRFAAETDGGPVMLGCDIHLWMRAWIYVFSDEPYAVTDAAGRFEIADVRPGRYRAHVRQADGGLAAEREVVVEAGQPTKLDVRFERADLERGQPTETNHRR